MLASPQRRIAIMLLLAAIAQPAWGVVHAALHAHIAAHHGEAPAALVLPGVQAELASSERPHEHEHPVVVYLRPTQGNDVPSAHALTVAAPAPRVVAVRRWSIQREAEAPRTSPESSGPSGPRAPPIA